MPSMRCECFYFLFFSFHFASFGKHAFCLFAYASVERARDGEARGPQRRACILCSSFLSMQFHAMEYNMSFSVEVKCTSSLYLA